MTGLRLPGWLWAVLLFALALVPRAFALGHSVTPDEPNWVYRTLNFGAALARGDWAGSVQAGHPGVTTMWLGSLGLAAQRTVDPARAEDAIAWLLKLDRLSPENVEAFKRIGVLLDWARLPVIVVNALGVAGVYLLARRIFGQRVALLAAGLLALDPFAAGLGGLLHVDGLLMTFSALSLLALLNGLSSATPNHSAFCIPHSAFCILHSAFCIPHSAFCILHSAFRIPHSAFRIPHSVILWFGLSGMCAGLAALSKSPALFLIPFTLIACVAAVLARRLSVRHAIIGFIIFFILHSTFFIALYPAMWSDPSTALDVMFERATYHVATATRPTFFDGQAELNHGLGFYPLALAYRLSPIVTIGLALTAVSLILRIRASHSHTPILNQRFAVLTLALFAFAFIAFLSPPAKKFDRYLLPTFPPLTLIAAWAIDQLSNQPSNHPSNPRSTKLTSLVGPAVVVAQALLVLSIAPYPLMAYNPLLGGAPGARDRIAVGWGEGFGASAQWVADQHPGSVIASGGLSNIAPLVDEPIVTIDAAGLARADYIVFTVSEVQLAPEFFDALAQRGTLAQTIRIGGVDAAWVYANARPEEQADWIRSQIQPGDAIVIDAPTPLVRALDPLSATVLPTDATPDFISTALDALRRRPRILHVSTDAASAVVRDGVRRWLDANARWMSEAHVADATIRIYTPESRASQPLDAFVVQFGGALALEGLATSTASAAYPDRIAVAARWRVIGPPLANYSATFELIDVFGDAWGQFGGPLRDASDFTPTNWQAGEVVDQVFTTQVPPALAPGTYRLRFSIDTPGGERLGLVSATGAFSGTAPILASVQIDPARQHIDPAALTFRQRADRVWPDQVRLIGVDLLTYVVAQGDPFLSMLHWQSLREGLDPSTELRWILSPQFETEAGPFEWHTALVPNTRLPLGQGDIIAARYSQRLPLALPDGRYHLQLGIGDQVVDVADTIDLVHRDRAFQLPVEAIRVGSIGTFEVYRVGSLPTQVRAGDQLQAKFVLRASDEVIVNYTFFVHLVDPAGRIVAQIDTWPQGGLWPTANFVRGQVVEDSFTLTPPVEAAPGAYHIAVGMYDALDGSRLPVRDDAGHFIEDGRLILDAPIQIITP